MALLNTGVDVNYMSQNTSRWMGLMYVSTSEHFKSVNDKWTQLMGEAKGVPMNLGQWTGTANFFVALIDDSEMFFGMRFIAYF